MNGLVRRAENRDLTRVAALWTAITRYHEPIDPLFRMRPDSDGELDELLRKIMRDPDAEILVYEFDESLIGLCIVRLDYAPAIMHETVRAQITDLGVSERARRRGIGTQLVEEALAWVRSAGVERVEVQVAAENPASQAFWRARGFADLMDVLHKRL